jgi:hypothetical protein
MPAFSGAGAGNPTRTPPKHRTGTSEVAENLSTVFVAKCDQTERECATSLEHKIPLVSHINPLARNSPWHRRAHSRCEQGIPQVPVYLLYPPKQKTIDGLLDPVVGQLQPVKPLK